MIVLTAVGLVDAYRTVRCRLCGLEARQVQQQGSVREIPFEDDHDGRGHACIVIDALIVETVDCSFTILNFETFLFAAS